MATPSPDHLLLEIEDLIRTMPGLRDFSENPDVCVPWLGRANAAVRAWDSTQSIIQFEPLVRTLSTGGSFDFSGTRRNILVQLHQAQNALRLATTGPLSVAIDSGRVFDYFDEVRKLIELAKVDILFVDPYLDAEFVARYLSCVPDGTSVRLLARERVASLVPAVALFVAQSKIPIEVRTAPGFHDRYIIVDGAMCYQSGASFKDGAKRTPTTLTQITDAFAVVQETYERLWTLGTPV
jgi:hypothetical protein